MIYAIYIFSILLFSVLIFPEFPRYVYQLFKVDRKYIAGLFASLGISTLANKIDYILYWDLVSIKQYWFSITFAIIVLLIGLWLFENKEE